MRQDHGARRRGQLAGEIRVGAVLAPGPSAISARGTMVTPASFSCASISDAMYLSPNPSRFALTSVWWTASPTIADDRQRFGEVRVIAKILHRVDQRELEPRKVARFQHLARHHLEDAGVDRAGGNDLVQLRDETPAFAAVASASAVAVAIDIAMKLLMSFSVCP